MFLRHYSGTVQSVGAWSMTVYERSKKEMYVKEFRELSRTMDVLGLENEMKRRILSIVQ